MTVHLEGAVEIELVDFFREITRALRRREQHARDEDLFIHPGSFDFGGQGSNADEGLFRFTVVETEALAHQPLDEIDASKTLPVEMDLDLIWLLAERILGGSAARHEVAYGVPRMDTANGTLFVPVVINSENARGTSVFTQLLGPEWMGKQPVVPARDFWKKQGPALSKAPTAQPENDPWLSTAQNLPEDGQSVLFIVEVDDSSRYAYLNGTMLGGVFHDNHVTGGFSVPGLTLSASHWQPAPPLPAALLPRHGGPQC